MDTTEAGAAMPWKKPLRVQRRIANHRKVEIPIKILITAAKKIMAVDIVMKSLGALKEKNDPAQSAHFLNFIADQIGFDILSNLQQFKAAGKKQDVAKEKVAPAAAETPEQP